MSDEHATTEPGERPTEARSFGSVAAAYERGRPPYPREAAAWHKSEELAAQILTGEERLKNTTGGATHYHAAYVRPVWAPALEKTAHIGRHIFYRDGRNS